MTHARRAFALFLFALFLLVAAIGLRPLHAQTLTLHSFDGAAVAADGRQPAASLTLGIDGNYYGTTQSGGSAHEGTIFKITPAGTITILHSFGDGSVANDGRQPVAALLSTGDGNFYGTTQYGGTTTATDPAGLGYGTAFKITSMGAVTILHDFGDGSIAHDGQEPVAGLITEGDGSLYGVTEFGGSTATSGAGHLASGNGAAFKITLSGVVTILHSFGDGSVVNDGTAPLSAMKRGTDGYLYGTTAYGGSTTASDPDGFGYGTAFKMTPGGLVTILHNFGDGTLSDDGQTPLASLIQARDGNFYGTTNGGGAASAGTVFEMTPSGTVTILHSFGDGTVAADGIYPAASLVQGSDGSFYGTTEYGGAQNDGTAFKVTAGTAYALLHSFGDVSLGSDGRLPMTSLVQGSDGSFYGTASEGGSTAGANGIAGDGAIFRMTLTGMVTTLHSFGDGSVAADGRQPAAPLILGSDGDYYGTTPLGGAGNLGTVFKITPAGAITVLHSFSDGTVAGDGAQPMAALVLGSDGDYYGTTQYGGAAGVGAAFKMTASGSVTILHSFGDGSTPNDGQLPIASLLPGGDGNFYGTTQAGGANNNGTAFKMTASGTVTILHSFNDPRLPSDGHGPVAPLILGSDGSFYGTTPLGGSAGNGTVFKLTLSGTITILHSFGDGTVANDGHKPMAALVQGRDGSCYGTTQSGGAGGSGTVFKISPSGFTTILHAFKGVLNTHDGALPIDSLIQDTEGNFYGTTQNGGAAGMGTVFKLTPAGTMTLLHSFGDGTVVNDGQQPLAALVQSPDGRLYGTAQVGGSGGQGTVFQITPALVTTFTARTVCADANGTAHILWNRSDGAAVVWNLDAADVNQVDGPVYGPYSDGGGVWSAQAVKAAPDGTLRLLWTRSDGAAGVWTMNAAGVQITSGVTYGPYADFYGTWRATDLAVAFDGTTRLLWSRSDGAAGVWKLDASGTETGIGAVYGPYADGHGAWHAAGIAGADAGTVRLLWLRSDGAAGIWTLNGAGFETLMGPVYGPISDSQGVWQARALGASSSGAATLLWTRSDGAAGAWTFGTGDAQIGVGPVYGPYPGFTATSLDAAANQSRILWTRADRAAGLWSLNASDIDSLIGPVYGPY